MFNNPEELWESILSRQPDRVQQAFNSLNQVEQQSVMAHLRSMSNEPGWHPEQRLSAQLALQVLEAS
jgi:hypothetical protein